MSKGAENGNRRTGVVIRAPVSSIRNLGPAMEAACARAGIHSAGEVHELGAEETYRRLLLAGERPHFIGYYAIEMGLHGRPWNDCNGKEKEALRERFDTVVASVRPGRNRGMEEILNEIGVVNRRGRLGSNSQPTSSIPAKK